mmetsp:Transcript_3806/g.9198  ORF Transcript_3806/g.9198 Transcript_3806/m.9198 type:complete len:92 (+) Transcript_3806:82-357(+)
MHLSTSIVFHFQRLRAGCSFDITMAIFEKSFTLESTLSSSSQKLLSVEDKIEMHVCMCACVRAYYYTIFELCFGNARRSDHLVTGTTTAYK